MSRGVLKWLARFVGLAPAEQPTAEPESKLNKARESLNDAIARYDRGLAARASLCETLRTQIRALETDYARLSSALEVHAKSPTPGPEAAELALRWQTAGDDLAALREQLQEAETRLAELSAAREQAIEAARKKWAEIKSAP